MTNPFHEDRDIGKPIEPLRCPYCQTAEFTGVDRKHAHELLEHHIERKHLTVTA
jgi:hypothetical protein